MASTRFPGKIIHPILGLPMIEHVRRRCLLASSGLSVYVATCDNEIAQVVESFGGQVIMTSVEHENGTSRTIEAISKIDCTHVILVQGDEPLVLPAHIDQLFESMQKVPEQNAWNLTSNIKAQDELDDKSIVKCIVGADERILYCFRRSPSYALYPDVVTYMHKMMGMLGFRKDFLQRYSKAKSCHISAIESIEQLGIIDAGFDLKSLHVEPNLPSVNKPEELVQVIHYLRSDIHQIQLLNTIMTRAR
jgi:3-deoxy-manno-octulosonate cytidylyltransferase (CMP-KDO synthetase)